MKTKNYLSDEVLAAKLQRQIDTLEKTIDCIAETPIRHALSERIVECRLLVRDGNLRNMNSRKGPTK